ncbi:universal stress protein [Zavarzinia compransoris]|uniref:Universal stress protein UspA n=1 Tax=Zavarzinia compransoris TaxID=1264899 RepID=A0A317DUK6_9PROT|nr:universal stress protein [Zavarzinia compransoris]PWR18321.1 universal stress protein UspA [Zavarzinia compransoris]TDP43620.1 nucleotide-binding universal stress UspA family protein [Zavarzinia compransoris]
MYRHLLVPIDGSDLSTLTVGRAVEFARLLNARITFFHALPDHAASLRGEVDTVRLLSPGTFAYAYEDRARELLAKAESAARARGVACDSRSALADAPYRAILDAARQERCDLIFMASHGRSSVIGTMLGSQTLKVLVNSEIPVLVSATADPPAPLLAINIIRDEHRSLSAVLQAWLHLIKTAEDGGEAPDPAAMRAIMHYIRHFPVALHHPKEEAHLFARLRQRTSEFNPDLDELERQHARDRQLLAELETLVEGQIAGTVALPTVREAVDNYARFLWDHLGREESVILPAAERFLTEADWAEIGAAFAANEDPRFGGEADAAYRQLFSRIVNLLPSR